MYNYFKACSQKGGRYASTINNHRDWQQDGSNNNNNHHRIPCHTYLYKSSFERKEVLYIGQFDLIGLLISHLIKTLP